MSVQELASYIKIPEISAAPPSNGEAIFMTGATGFLGARLLHDLLAASDKAFICLVRAGSEEEGLQRILQAMAKQGLHVTKEAQSRIHVICGDITREYFGLSEEGWHSLCAQTKLIIHCAAIVNMVKSFEELRAANFDACAIIMRLALESGVKHIDYISTLSVFVSTDQNEGRVLESDRLCNIGKVYGGYAQTKVAAELAFHHPDFTKHVHVTSYRLGLITGDTSGGRSAPHDFLSTFFDGIMQLGCYPQGDFSHLKVDVTPVDFASACLTQLLLQDDKQECYHIANVEGFSLPQMINVMKGRGINLRAVPVEDWQALPQVRDLKAHEQAAWLGLCRVLSSDDFSRYRSMDLFQATNIDFDMARLKAALPAIEYPKADDVLLNLYLQEAGL
jgi:thioester reductase-like protein